MQTNLFDTSLQPTESIYSLINEIDLINNKIKLLLDKKVKLKQIKKINEVDKEIDDLKRQGDNIWKKINKC